MLLGTPSKLIADVVLAWYAPIVIAAITLAVLQGQLAANWRQLTLDQAKESKCTLACDAKKWRLAHKEQRMLALDRAAGEGRKIGVLLGLFLGLDIFILLP